MRLPRMTIRRWMFAVAAVALVLGVRSELQRIKQQQVEAEIRAMAQALSDYRPMYKYPHGAGCRISLDVEAESERSQ